MINDKFNLNECTFAEPQVNLISITFTNTHVTCTRTGKKAHLFLQNPPYVSSVI